MKRNLIDASQLELEDKVVSIKRVTCFWIFRNNLQV